MRKRQGKDIWHGLFDFFLIEKSKPVNPKYLIREKEHREWFAKTEGVKISKRYKHILTHQTIHCRFLHIEAAPSFTVAAEDLAFYTADEINRLPKPALISR